MLRNGENGSARFPWTHGMAFLALLFFWAAGAPPASGAAQCSNAVAAAGSDSWARWECVLEVQGVGLALAGRNPYLLKLEVTYSAAQQPERRGYAFWDGLVPGTTDTHRFRLRMQFPPSVSSPKTWTWSTSCETPAYCSEGKTQPSLVTTGTLVVTNSNGGNPLYQGGPIRIVADPLPELYQGNQRFAWIGDSAWVAPLRASAAEWAAYLENRRSAASPFSANSAALSILHIGPAPSWAGFVPDPGRPSHIVDRSGNPPFDTLAGCISGEVVPNRCSIPNFAFWRAFEDKIETANQQGLYLFLAGLMEPHQRYPTADEAVRFASWLAARLSGNFVVFSPGFDSPPNRVDAGELQKAVGSAIKATAPQHLLTNHWSTDDNIQATLAKMASLHNESWLDFEMFQSGFLQGNEPELTRRARELAQIVAGHTGLAPFATLRKATINGEAIYDDGGTTKNGRPAFRAYRARQTGYLSWLAGASGYTHGTGGIWDWGACAGPKPNACGHQMPPLFRSYRDAMAPDGQSFKNVKYLGEALRRSLAGPMVSWEQWRIKGQKSAQEKKMVVARTGDGMIAYLPHNRQITLDVGSSGINTFTGKLWNPATGTFDEELARVHCLPRTPVCTWTNAAFKIVHPDDSDRLLMLAAKPAKTWYQTNNHQLEAFSGRFEASKPVGIHGLFLNPAGMPIGEPFEIHSAKGQEPTAPAVGRDGKGKFLIVWTADSNGDSLSEIWGKWIDEGKINIAPAFRISPEDGSEHLQPAVAISSDGKAFVTWTKARWPLHSREVWARSVAGTTLGESVSICAGDNKSCFGSKVAGSLKGGVTIAWVESDKKAQESVMLQSFASQDLRHKATPIQQVNRVELPAFWLKNLHIDAGGVVVAEYEGFQVGSSAGVYTQAFDAAGQRSGSERLIVPALTGQ